MGWFPQPVGVPGAVDSSADPVVTPTTLVPALPAGRLTGDTVLCFTACPSSTPTVATPSGWTSLVNQSVTNGRIALFARNVDGSETAPSVVWSSLTTGLSGTPCMAQCMAFRGLNATLASLVDVIGAVNTTSSQTAAAGGGAITNTAKSALFLSLSVRASADGSWTLLGPAENIWWHEFTGALNSTSGADMAMDWDWGYKGGPVGTVAAKTKTITGSATSAVSGGVMVALKPKAGVGTQTLFKPSPTSGSPWNEPLPTTPTNAGDAAAQLASLEAVRSAAAPRGITIDSGNYNVPTWNVPAGTPRVPMILMTAPNVTIAETQDQFGTARQRLAWRFAQGVPLTDDMRPAGGTDAHMTVVDDGTGELWDCFTVWRDGGTVPWTTPAWTDGSAHILGTGTWRVWYGGYIADHRTNIGQFNDELSPAYQSAGWGATATSLPGSAGEILLSELLAGTIPHALQLLLPHALAGHVWPAQRDDGIPPGDTQYTQLVSAGMTPTVFEGARFKLKSTVSTTVTTGYGAHFDAVATILLTAMQTYGMVVNDRVGYLGGMQLRAEPGCYEWFAPGGGAPNYGAPFADSFMRALLPAFNTTNWDVIDPTFRPAGAESPLIETVTDNFNDNSIDPAIWVTSGAVAETGQELRLSCVGSAYSRAQTAAGKTLHASFVSSKARQRPTGDTSDQSGFAVVNAVNANCKITFYVYNANLVAEYLTSAPTTVTVLSSAYSPTNHLYTRIREAGGTIFYETSATGAAGSWSTFASFLWSASGWPAANLDNVYAGWFAGNFSGVAGRPDYVIDDVNLAAVTPIAKAGAGVSPRSASGVRSPTLGFTTKTWIDRGNPGATPVTAAALIDMETRLSSYARQLIDALKSELGI